jgi:glycosyltransferase involved in cell wall biosynthesis
MKVLILTSSNPNKIAGIVAKDLLESLQRNDWIEPELVVREYESYKQKNIRSVNSKVDHYVSRASNRLKFTLRKFNLSGPKLTKTDPKYNILDYNQSKEYYSTKKILKKANFKPDAIIILFMQRFLNFQNLFELQQITGAPIYLYLMDMASFTGGCHYAWDCRGYIDKCGKCPGLYSANPLDQTRLNWDFKNSYIKKTNLEIIIASTQLNNQALSSSLFKQKKIHPRFYLPVNEQLYKPADKAVLKQEFNLPFGKKIVFFGASLISDSRKGFKELIESLEALHRLLPNEKKDIIHLLIAGHVGEDILASIPFEYTSLGYLLHTQLPKAFQVADVFASSSIEDSGPMMVNQSLMCGTPVVAYEIGVASDLVHNGVTGYKAKLKNSQDFAKGLLSLLELDEIQTKQISNNCRELALSAYSRQAVSEKWSELLKLTHVTEC